MSTWLGLLPLDIQDVNDLIEPTDEIKEGETVAGVMSDELKKILTLCRSLKKSAELLTVELKYTKGSDPERTRIAELMTKATVLEMIFWIGVRDELQLWDQREHLALRVGWQMVKFKQPDIPFPFNFLMGNQQ